MTEVISVRFRGGCKNYYFDPKGVQVKMGDQVIVETAQGAEFATCTEGNHEVADEAIVQPLCAVLRMATENDRRTVEYKERFWTKQQPTIFIGTNASAKNYPNKEKSYYDCVYSGSPVYQYIQVNNDTLSISTYELHSGKQIDKVEIIN